MTDIVLQGLTKTYDDGTEAVRNLDLTVKSGSFLVLLGPSGCGKSTLLRMIAGVEPITDGSVYFNDTDVTDLPANKRKVSMVFQNFTLYPNLNVYKNLAFPLENKKFSQEEIDQRVKKIAELLGLTSVLNRKSRSLSGGQKQRTALGRALINEPDVFLLDEPLSNLDQTARMQLRRDILAIHEKLGTTFIFVTHDQSEAMEMGTHIAIMNEGRIEQVGTPMQLYENPATSYVAGFLGRPKMNFYHVVPKQSTDGWIIPMLGTDMIISEKRIEQQYKNEIFSELTIGIRPEDIQCTVCDEEADEMPEEWETPALPAVVETAVPTGSGYQLQLRMENVQEEITALVKDGLPIRGDAMKLLIDPERVYVFDPFTGENLLKMHPVHDIKRVRSVEENLSDEGAAGSKEPAFKRLVKTFFSQFFALMGLNLLFIVTCLGVITIPASITALCRVCIKMEEDENVFLLRDYMRTFRRDFKKSLQGGVLLIGILLVLMWVIWMYSQMAQSQKLFLVLGFVAVFLLIGVYITAMYFFPMHAMIELPVGVLLQNSFVLACQGGIRTAGAFLVSLISFGLLGIGLMPYSFIYMVIFMFSITTLINMFILYPLIRMRVITPENRCG